MKRWLPHPLMAGFLLLAWLLLQQSLAPGTIILGVILALTLARVFGKLQPPPVQVRRIDALMLLLIRVCSDIIRSNIAVAKIIIGRRRGLTSGFVAIPLDMTNRYALAMLACIITATPGTVWVSHDSSQQRLLIHVLDLIDENAWITKIKQRYEHPLLEIFR